MTLKTLTGPSIAAALADARRLFGDGVVLLQSTPAALGDPASVTVGFDAAPVPAPPPRPAAPAPAPPRPAPAPRPYGYPTVRNDVPPTPEPMAAPAPPPAAPAPPAPPSAPAPATARELDTLRARLADLEGEITALRHASRPLPAPPARAVVFVGPAGGGKTTLALRLAQSPELLGAAIPAAIVVAPEGPFADPSPLFWAAGVPVAVVRTAEETAEALRLFEGAGRIVVDTPALPLPPSDGRRHVARLGTVLGPLGAAEVVFAVEATRAAGTVDRALLRMMRLRPDGLAVTRLDEAPTGDGAWADALGLPLRLRAHGRSPSHLARAARPVPAAPPSATHPPSAPDLRTLVASVIAGDVGAACAHA